MNKRRFLKSTLLTGAAVLAKFTPASASEQKASKKNWLWIHPNPKDTDDDLKKQYSALKAGGINGIFFEADSERHYRLAKKSGLEAHRWMWIMNRGEKELLESHPEWYAKNKLGESCADKPPYVGYYRWLCPSRPEVLEYLKAAVTETLKKDYVDGIHLDYIRYSDVILPFNLWDNYKIEQTKELPEYDYCYCEVCREKFIALKGIDPLELKYPDQNLSWRKYRYDRITTVVNSLAEVARQHKKPITAAVFPTPEIAKRNVRQDWVNWNLDGIFPMIYHGFYKEEVPWIGDAVQEGVSALHGKFPLYAGLFLPDFKNEDEIRAGIKTALQNGAAGISFFGRVDEKVLTLLRTSLT